MSSSSAAASSKVDIPAAGITDAPDEEHEAASHLMRVFSLGRYAAQLDECRRLTRGILASTPHAPVLPQLICYLRNHAKSLGQGQGKGEKKVAETMAVALFLEDAPVGKMLMRMLVCYGSWRSLSNILKLCDDETDEASAKSKRRGTEIDFKPLLSCIYDMFAQQLKQDSAKLSTPGEAVSNCSKYAPHEGRSKKSAKHADAIAQLLFGKGKSGSIRRQYRQLRSKINERNGHLPDRMLAMGRADELDVASITAGYFSKSRKALLNLPKSDKVRNAAPPVSKKRRYDDPARIDLRHRVLEFSAKASNIPAPSSISELADSMLAEYNNDNADPGETLILNRTYERAVMELVSRIQGRTNEVMKLRKAMGKSKEGSSDLSLLREVLVAVDVSASQSHCLHVCALMCLLFADASDKLKEVEMHNSVKNSGNVKASSDDQTTTAAASSSTAEGSSSASRDHWCCIFERSALTIKIPSRYGGTHLPIGHNEVSSASHESALTNEDDNEKAPTTPLHRLAELTQVFRAGVPGPDMGNRVSLTECVNIEAAVDCILELQSATSTKSDILICSDFNGEEAVTAAKRYSTATDGGTICAWKMVAPARMRGRKISWDPKNPQIDVCFVLDTTGSMGTWINACRQHIVAILDSLQDSTDGTDESDEVSMPVSCSFVSYKDFGDSGHLEVHPWSDVADANAMAELRSFISTLRASGGGDIEEDVAGGLEKARDLMRARSSPSIKLVVLIADAAGHGYPRGRQHHGGVDQKKRLEAVTKDLCGGLGCELLLTRITSHTTPMRKDMDAWVASYRTFVDEFDLAGTSSAVFKEKVVASLKQVVAEAVSPPSAEGIDVYGGCDFGLMTALCTTRLAEYMAELAQVEKAKVADDVETSDGHKSSEKSEKSAATAFQNMLAKCNSEDYDLVRTAMGALQSGVFEGYTPPAGHGLAEASVRALIDAGATLPDIKAAGYPIGVTELFETVIQSRITRGAAKRGKAE